jgi:Zn-dependent protease
MEDLLRDASTWVLPALTAITLHEAAHGWAAWRLGDDTAMRLGRVSFNPLRHVDLVGTVILPAALLLMRAPFLFGWAKPVPVDFMRLRHPRRDMVWVALAGPGANLVLATAAALSFHAINWLPASIDDWVADNLRNAILLNLVLAVFNMLPIPPLDGGRVAVGLLPASLARPLARMERAGLFLVLGLFFLLPLLLREVGIGVDPLRLLIDGPVSAMFDLLLLATGHR